MRNNTDMAKGTLSTKHRTLFGEVVHTALSQLEGATIITAGFHNGCDEGGFAIDFQHKGKPVQRLVLGYTELGEWIEFLGPRKP